MTASERHQGWISRMSLRGARGALVLAVVLALGAVAAQSAQAQTFTVLHNFTGSPDGGQPFAGPTMLRITINNWSRSDLREIPTR
jgi:hypothetical protein